MSWPKVGRLREDAARFLRDAAGLRERSKEVQSRTGPTERRHREALVVLSKLDRQISAQLNNNEVPLGCPARRQHPRHRAQLPPQPRAMRQPDELEAQASQLRTDAKGMIAEPAQHDALMEEAYQLETLALENRLRIQLANVDTGTRARLKPELERRRAALSSQLAVLVQELEHETRPQVDLRAEIARLEKAAQDATSRADTMERGLLGLSELAPVPG